MRKKASKPITIIPAAILPPMSGQLVDSVGISATVLDCRGGDTAWDDGVVIVKITLESPAIIV